MNDALWVVGDFAWDVLIRTNAPLQTGGDTYGEVGLAPGGSAANAAVWAQRCGRHAHFVGKVGSDRLGDLAAENLAEEGVEALLMHAEGRATGSVAVWIDHAGERSMVSGKGADHDLLPSELPRERLAQAGHLHLSGWSFFADPPRTAVREAAKIAKAGGATVSFDPASFQLIETVGVERFLGFLRDLEIDLIFPNYEEGAVLTGERDPERIVAALADRCAAAQAVLKLDARGARVQTGPGESVAIPATPSQMVDATGAGDAFAGAFLADWLEHRDAVRAATFAADVSAWVVEQAGARPKPDARLRRRLVEHGRADDGDGA
jgi:sugar/nucleoside kinase (ribokinase family)